MTFDYSYLLAMATLKRKNFLSFSSSLALVSVTSSSSKLRSSKFICSLRQSSFSSTKIGPLTGSEFRVIGSANGSLKY